jgi:hypothetical protein
MKSLWATIKKLLTALSLRGERYLVNREMVYSAKLDKMCTVYKLNRLTPIDEYYKKHPEKKRRKNDEREYIKEPIFSSFKEVDIVLNLAAIYKGGGQNEATT